MDISPSTVCVGDEIHLLVTQSEDGEVTPAEHECSLLLKEGEAKLDGELDTHDIVKVELTVTKCIWGQSKDSNMLLVDVESVSGPVERDGNQGEAQDTGSGGDRTASRQSAGTTAKEVTDEASIDSRDTSREEATAQKEVTEDVDDERIESNDTGPDRPDRDETLRCEASEIVDWDADEPLNRDMLERVLNRGERVPDPSMANELDYGDRNAVEIADLLIDLSSGLEVSSAVCYRAAELYTEAMEQDLIHGNSRVTTAAAVFRIATLLEDEHRPLVAIEDVLTTSLGEPTKLGEIADQQRRLISELDIDPTVKLPQPQKFLPFLARQLELDEDAPIIKEAESIAMRAIAQGSGNNPWSIAAAAVYSAGLQDGVNKLTQSEVAWAANLSEVTIRNNYKSMLDD